MNQLFIGDALTVLKTLPNNSVHCCVTSPPYFRQRDYGHTRQLGQENSVARYIEHLVAVFDEIHRILVPDGSLWLNIGDTVKLGEMLAVPARLQLALRERWSLINEIAWVKPTCTPQKISRRFAPSHEKIFWMAKSNNYFVAQEALREPSADAERGTKRPQQVRARQLFEQHKLTDAHLDAARAIGLGDAGKAKQTQNGTGKNTQTNIALAGELKGALGGYAREMLFDGATRNARDVWEMPVSQTSLAHCAPFPIELPQRAIATTCHEGGVVLDPFFGAGTTGLAAQRLGRGCIGIELNSGYAELARARLWDDAPLFARWQVTQ